MGLRSRSSSSFSITQFLIDLANANPHANIAYVPSLGREMLYSHQISLFSQSPPRPYAPYALEPRSLFVSGICDTETVARKVFVRLTDAGVLDANGCVRTIAIDGKKFAHQVRCLVLPRQRELVDLLFWWEEECMRLRKLIETEQELTKTIKDMDREQRARGPDVAEGRDEANLLELERLRFEREKVRMRIRQRPSERREDIEMERDTLFEEVQRVSAHVQIEGQEDGNGDGGVVGRRRTEPIVSGRRRGDPGRPPAYRP